MKMIRQGDIQFIKVANIPATAKRRPGAILFRGEATGHAHRIDVGTLFESADGLLYLKTESLARVSHEEHKTISLPPGEYLVSQKRQYPEADIRD